MFAFAGPGPGPKFMFIGSGPQFMFTDPGSKFVFTSPNPNLYWPTLAPVMTPDLYFPVQVKILLLPQLLILLLSLSLASSPPLLLLLLLLLMIIITTRDAFAAAKSALKGPWKIFDEKVESCFSKFVSVMANVFPIREANEMNADNCRDHKNE